MSDQAKPTFPLDPMQEVDYPALGFDQDDCLTYYADGDRWLAKVRLDSVSPCGVRLTTLEVQFPRIVLAEFNTHRVFSRNSASSRAIPVEKLLERVRTDPYIPETWGRNRSGMQATEALGPEDAERAKKAWLEARDRAVEQTEQLLEIGVHKQTTNRLLEPFLWHTVIVTATDWSNFLHLRDHEDAHPAIQRTAHAMQFLLKRGGGWKYSHPILRAWGEWHLPYVYDRDREGVSLSDEQWAKVSVARCARVSYLTHDGRRDVEEDLALHDRLLAAGHMSPFEHAARCVGRHALSNFAYPWLQYRKTIPYEHDVHANPERRKEE